MVGRVPSEAGKVLMYIKHIELTRTGYAFIV